MVALRVVFEAMAQAFQQLRSNPLRSFLSLLGISIGIFCIIGVLSAVDSLEDNVRGSLEKLGNDVVYVKKWPWADASGAWWKYIKRPNPDYDDYEAVQAKAKTT
ncbi:MAG TPA: ABC transporter permease, partial [Saprospiraceae bacterium]|nr:ABC transporter permease [Saprospiraceae bacterium]